MHAVWDQGRWPRPISKKPGNAVEERNGGTWEVVEQACPLVGYGHLAEHCCESELNLNLVLGGETSEELVK